MDFKQIRYLEKIAADGHKALEIEEYKDKLESTPMYATYDMGYGPYYTFVKKVDYERIKRETT